MFRVMITPETCRVDWNYQ